MQVKCRVVLPAQESVRPGAQVRVLVEDVSVQDVAAPVLASVTFPAEAGARELGPFTVEFTPPPTGRAAIRVHVDQNGDGQVRVGDLVSVARHNAPHDSVAMTGSAAAMEIPVKVVTG
jgi:hypothetical protein